MDFLPPSVQLFIISTKYILLAWLKNATFRKLLTYLVLSWLALILSVALYTINHSDQLAAHLFPLWMITVLFGIENVQKCPLIVYMVKWRRMVFVTASCTPTVLLTVLSVMSPGPWQLKLLEAISTLLFVVYALDVLDETSPITGKEYDDT